jgi:hypothetical protein
MENYIIVLFKNKKKKKIIKGYATEKNALSKYNQLIKNNDIPFNVVYENSERCNYEIGLLTKTEDYQIPLFKADEVGRNNNVFIEGESDYTIKRVEDYRIEEMIFDWKLNRRISFHEFISLYCPKNNVKVISKLHNKIVVQNDEVFNLFSLKNEEDSERFLQTLESLFYNSNRNDSIFVRDESTINRKWMYDVLEKTGFDRKKLYRQKTTFSKRT